MGRPPKLTPHQRRKAIKRRDTGDETLADIGRFAEPLFLDDPSAGFLYRSITASAEFNQQR